MMQIKLGFTGNQSVHRNVINKRRSQVMDTQKLEQLLNQIAAEHLHIDTLATRNSDRLDFHEVSVWGLKEALQAAFTAGQQSKQTTQTN
jgi:RNase adaptor protein for sRNA GlmZ degradation